MMCLSKWISATLAIALMANVAAAADAIATGKITAINVDSKTFAVTDSADKKHNFKLGDDFVVNRAGKESKDDLKIGDSVSVCHDNGTFKWTAHYILVHEGTTKNSNLSHVTVKSYDPVKKQLFATDLVNKNAMYEFGNAPVRVNMKDSTVQELKVGDHALIISNTVGTSSTLTSVMVQRAK